jgi:hypothetical protein
MFLTFILSAVGILLISFAFVIVFLKPVFDASKPTDEANANNKRNHDAIMQNQRNQGLVLDMEAYRNGTEQYITVEAAAKQKQILPKILNSVSSANLAIQNMLTSVRS